jgi:hypothetical protein
VRADFEAAWRDYLPGCTEADFTEYRRQRDWTGWHYAMWDAGLKLATQLPDGRARCFCGKPIDIPGTAQHVYAAHMSTLARPPTEAALLSCVLNDEGQRRSAVFAIT